MERVQLVKTENVKEFCDVEIKLDSDHMAELVKLRAELTERLLNDLVANKEGLAADLQHEGQLYFGFRCYVRITMYSFSCFDTLVGS